jgi:hypothetical protein
VGEIVKAVLWDRYPDGGLCRMGEMLLDKELPTVSIPVTDRQLDFGIIPSVHDLCKDLHYHRWDYSNRTPVYFYKANKREPWRDHRETLEVWFFRDVKPDEARKHL